MPPHSDMNYTGMKHGDALVWSTAMWTVRLATISGSADDQRSSGGTLV